MRTRRGGNKENSQWYLKANVIRFILSQNFSEKKKNWQMKFSALELLEGDKASTIVSGRDK